MGPGDPVSTILTQLNAVPGVLGSMVADGEGKLVAHAFPERFDPTRLRVAAEVLAERSAGLDAAVGVAGTIDLRFAMARLVLRPVTGGRILFLCTPSVNLQTLLLSTAGAVRRLEALLAAPGAAAPPAPAPAPSGALHLLVQEIDAAIERSGGDRFRLRGKIALTAGFSLDLIDADAPDDPPKLLKLKAAASAVLGRPF